MCFWGGIEAGHGNNYGARVPEKAFRGLNKKEAYGFPDSLGKERSHKNGIQSACTQAEESKRRIKTPEQSMQQLKQIIFFGKDGAF